MEKTSAISRVNGQIGHRLLNGRNTSFANVNAAKAVWWLNINPFKFTSELHLLLADDSKGRLIWLRIEANSIPEPAKLFRIRGDNGAVDLEISCLPPTYMMDVKSGGIGYNFSRHIVNEWEREAVSYWPAAEQTSGLQVANGTDLNEPEFFQGTGVPVKELHSYFKKDWNLYGFLREFPSVSMEQALAELERDAREKTKRIIEWNEEIADGALVFERTDVPVKRMFDYLADVKSLKDFHWDHPSVLREYTHDGLVISGRILELDAYRGAENGVVHSDRRIVSGAPLFVGTRLPMIFLFQHLADGQTLKDFHYHYSSAEPKHLIATVKVAGKALEREFHAAVPG